MPTVNISTILGQIIRRMYNFLLKKNKTRSHHKIRQNTRIFSIRMIRLIRTEQQPCQLQPSLRHAFSRSEVRKTKPPILLGSTTAAENSGENSIRTKYLRKSDVPFSTMMLRWNVCVSSVIARQWTCECVLCRWRFWRHDTLSKVTCQQFCTMCQFCQSVPSVCLPASSSLCLSLSLSSSVFLYISHESQVGPHVPDIAHARRPHTMHTQWHFRIRLVCSYGASQTEVRLKNAWPRFQRKYHRHR